MPRRNNFTSNRDRDHIVECYSQGQDFLALAVTLGVNRSTAYGIVRNYQQTERVQAVHAGGRRKIIDNEMIDLILMIIENNPLLTLTQIREEARNIWPDKSDFSLSTLSRSLDGELVTLKQCHDIPL